MIPKAFIKAYYPYAKQTQDKTGIDARFTLAQAALESAWGEKAPGNMFFGVKAGQNTQAGQKQLLRTREVLSAPNAQFPEIISITPRSDGKYDYIVKDWFRKYDTPEECFTDHANMLLGNPNFRHALPYIGDPYRYADEIQNGRKKYATDPNYSQILKDVIRTVERNMQAA